MLQRDPQRLTHIHTSIHDINHTRSTSLNQSIAQAHEHHMHHEGDSQSIQNILSQAHHIIVASTHNTNMNEPNTNQPPTAHNLKKHSQTYGPTRTHHNRFIQSLVHKDLLQHNPKPTPPLTQPHTNPKDATQPPENTTSNNIPYRPGHHRRPRQHNLRIPPPPFTLCPAVPRKYVFKICYFAAFWARSAFCRPPAHTPAVT